MPDNNPKFDRFKPAQPRIPGVADAAPPERPADEPTPFADVAKPQFSLPPAWIAAAVVAALVLVGLVSWWSHSRATTAGAPTVPSVESTLGSPAAAPTATGALPTAPGTVATADELAKPWAAKRFNYRNPLGNNEFPAMVVRLPEGGYWAFSLQEPYGKCELEFVTDIAKLQKEYGYPANHPMVGDPCTRTVYDLLRYGSGPAGLVRGEIMQGNAIRPPLAIEVRVEGGRIVAARTE